MNIQWKRLNSWPYVEISTRIRCSDFLLLFCISSLFVVCRQQIYKRTRKFCFFLFFQHCPGAPKPCGKHLWRDAAFIPLSLPHSLLFLYFLYSLIFYLSDTCSVRPPGPTVAAKLFPLIHSHEKNKLPEKEQEDRFYLKIKHSLFGVHHMMLL